MNVFKKCLSILLILVFAASALPVCISAAELKGSPSVIAVPPIIERNDYAGALGYCFTTTEKLEVYALGRPENNGITTEHGVRIWNIKTKEMVAEVIITPDSPLKDGFRYEVLAAPVTLDALTNYLVASDEEAGGDVWFDSDARWYEEGVDFDVPSIMSKKGFNFTGGCFGGEAGAIPVNLNTQFVYVLPQIYYETKGAEVKQIDEDGTLKPFIKKAMSGERNDISAYVGYEFMFYMDADIISLARPDNGMTTPHTLALWDIANKTLVASATVDTNSPVVDGYRVAELTAPVAVKAGTTYALVSWEDNGGDVWHDIQEEDVFEITDIGTVVRGIWTGEGDLSNPAFPSNPGPGVEGINGYVGATVFYKAHVAAEEPVTETVAETAAPETAPQTSDGMMIFVLLITGAAAVIFTKKTVKNKI